jgi:hypothetical protein
MPKIHGIELAKNSVFKNAVIESLAADPVLDVAGRIWFNTTNKAYKMATLDGEVLVAKTFPTKEAVEAAAAAYASSVASTTAGAGAGLVGYAGKTTTNLTVGAGTVEASLDSLVVAVDADRVATQGLDSRIDVLEANVGGAMGDLATLTTDAKDTIVAAINEVDAHIDAEVTARTVADTAEATARAAADTTLQGNIDAEATARTAADTTLQGNIDTEATARAAADTAITTDMSTNYLKKTGTEAQTVTPDVIFEGNVRLNGNLIQNGETFTVIGEEVIFEDNIVILNSNIAVDAEPIEDAGWGVNRGVKGELVVMKWDETADVVKSVKSITPEGVPTYDTIAFDSEVQAIADGLDARLDVLEANVGGAMGDLATLTTDAKDTIVAAINEVDAHIDAEVTRAIAVETAEATARAAADTTLQGNIDAEATTRAAADTTLTTNLATEVTAREATDAAAAARIAAEGSTTAGQGSGLIGFVGKTGTNGKYSVAAGTVEAAVIANVTAIDADRQVFADKVSAYASTTAGEGSALVGFSGQAADGDEPFGIAAGTTENALKAMVSEINNVYAELFMNEDKVDSLATQLNGTKFKTNSASATSHTIVHNLNSQEITANVWVKDGTSWKNHIVGITIIDNNTIQVDLTESFEVKVLVEKFDTVTI